MGCTASKNKDIVNVDDDPEVPVVFVDGKVRLTATEMKLDEKIQLLLLSPAEAVAKASSVAPEPHAELVLQPVQDSAPVRENTNKKSWFGAFLNISHGSSTSSVNNTNGQDKKALAKPLCSPFRDLSGNVHYTDDIDSDRQMKKISPPDIANASASPVYGSSSSGLGELVEAYKAAERKLGAVEPGEKKITHFKLKDPKPVCMKDLIGAYRQYEAAYDADGRRAGSVCTGEPYKTRQVTCGQQVAEHIIDEISCLG